MITGSWRKTRRGLRNCGPLMEEHADEVMSTLGLWIMGTKDAAKFFTEESRKKHVFVSQREWFLDLFSGTYDNRYYEKLIRIGAAHVKHKVDTHYMNRAVNLIKNACIGILSALEEDRVEVTNKIVSVGKDPRHQPRRHHLVVSRGRAQDLLARL